jgi:hypothetical protein
MMKEGWFFLFAGIIAVVSSFVDKHTPIVNDVDGSIREGEKELRPKRSDRLIYGVVGAASTMYGIYLLRH